MSLTTFKSDITVQGVVQGNLIVGDTDVGKAAKMFMWWMQTYHPEIEEQFNAVEDTKRGTE
jgi:hypothetical protein